MILSFRDKRSERLFEREYVRSVAKPLAVLAYEKMRLIDAATSLEFLRVPPGNRLEALRGARAGQCSIRVNAQWRICFCWHDGNAQEVEFCDCHD